MKYILIVLLPFALSGCGEDVKELYDRIDSLNATVVDLKVKSDALNATITNLHAETQGLRNVAVIQRIEIERITKEKEVMSEELSKFKRYAPVDLEVRMRKIYSMWND